MWDTPQFIPFYLNRTLICAEHSPFLFCPFYWPIITSMCPYLCGISPFLSPSFYLRHALISVKPTPFIWTTPLFMWNMPFLNLTWSYACGRRPFYLCHTLIYGKSAPRLKTRNALEVTENSRRLCHLADSKSESKHVQPHSPIWVTTAYPYLFIWTTPLFMWNTPLLFSTCPYLCGRCPIFISLLLILSCLIYLCETHPFYLYHAFICVKYALFIWNTSWFNQP